jgi:uncharacterized RDD family membrane protein YckC
VSEKDRDDGIHNTSRNVQNQIIPTPMGPVFLETNLGGKPMRGAAFCIVVLALLGFIVALALLGFGAIIYAYALVHHSGMHH